MRSLPNSLLSVKKAKQILDLKNKNKNKMLDKKDPISPDVYCYTHPFYKNSKGRLIGLTVKKTNFGRNSLFSQQYLVILVVTVGPP